MSCSSKTTKGNPCKNKVFGNTDKCKRHQEVTEEVIEEPTKITKDRVIIIGDGSFKLKPKKKGTPTQKTIKLRITTEENVTTFLEMMSKQFGKDYTQTKPYYENGLSQENLINVSWCWMLDFSNDPQKWGIIDIKVETQEQWDWFMNNTNNHNNSQNIYSVWYPQKPQEEWKGFKWSVQEDTKPIPTRHPIYIISKGRHSISGSRLTHSHLTEMGLPFTVVVETQEYDDYVKFSGIPEKNLMKLPKELCNLGKGGIPVRNFCWEHSQSKGHTHHWILDDNLNGFYRLHQNNRLKFTSGIFFNQVEDFMDRYHNLYQTGLGYLMDNPEIDKSRKCCILNTKVYSCMLIKNDLDQILEEKWRGTYNEDVDLSLRILKKGLPTVQFQTFLSNKEKTLGLKGGNTDELYKGTDDNKFDGLQNKVDSLVYQHPDCVKVTNKRHTDGRPHHTVNYTKFKGNPLCLLPHKKWTYNTYPELHKKMT